MGRGSKPFRLINKLLYIHIYNSGVIKRKRKKNWGGHGWGGGGGVVLR